MNVLKIHKKAGCLKQWNQHAVAHLKYFTSLLKERFIVAEIIPLL